MSGDLDMARLSQDQARAVLDEHGVTMFRAQVHALLDDGTVQLKRVHNVDDDGVTLIPDGAGSVRLDGARRLAVGAWVWCFSAGGQVFVWGEVLSANDSFLDDVITVATVDEKDTATLNSAKSYADTQDQGVAQILSPLVPGTVWVEIESVQFIRTKDGFIKARGRVEAKGDRAIGTRICTLPSEWCRYNAWLCAKFPSGSSNISFEQSCPMYIDMATYNLCIGDSLLGGTRVDLANVSWFM